ncbi:hypothetical protein H0H87_007145 [Tephrocybe sp. NHM501043]|nr:hypothetical protein H0H87_007145 [Tephrocybe sp. NHM501043]
MVQITSLLVIAAMIITTASVPLKRSDPLEGDILSISALTASLDDAIKLFASLGPGQLVDALAIHGNATVLKTQLDTATGDVSTGVVSEDDARTFLNSIEAFEPTIIDALTNIVSKKAAFQALPIGGIPALVLSDLRALNTSTTVFENRLLASTPPDLLAEGRQVQTSINAAFNKAIAAYA